MKDLSSLTVSRETGERLARAGFPQDTYAAWGYDQSADDYYLDAAHRLAAFTRVCAAPTAAEVRMVLDNFGVCTLAIRDAGGTVCAEVVAYTVGHLRGTDVPEVRAELERVNVDDCCDLPEPHGSDAEAAAALWLALVSTGHVSPAQEVASDNE